MFNLSAAILWKNRNRIYDGISESQVLAQTTHGNNLSPLQFLVLLKGFPDKIHKPGKIIKIIVYANDLDIYNGSHFRAQQALARLPFAVLESGLTVAVTKIEATEFRKSGRAVVRGTVCP